MKAERKNKAFEPVTITLETEDELNYLWYCLNRPKRMILENYESELNVSEDFDEYQMWKELDKIVRG